MNTDLLLVCGGLILGGVIFYVTKKENLFNKLDHYYGLEILENFNSSNIEDISDDHLETKLKKGEVLLAKHPKQDKENLKFFNPANTRYWPYYFYTYPYQYSEGGAYPPNMYSRLYHWQPGFDTAGWSYWMRPGMSYQRWPRNRWVRNNGSFYFINNGSNKDRARDYM